MNSVLVTGAAGLLGSATCRILVAGGCPVIGVDCLHSDQRFENLNRVPLADFVGADSLFDYLASKPRPTLRTTIHLGACTSTTEQDGDFLMHNNFAYTRTLAEWCLRHGVRFIYASSAATYGDGACGYGDDLAGLPRLRPLNKYAFSKHAFDLWALHHRAFEGPGAITGLKYFNVYGPNEAHKGDMRSMVLKAYEQIQATGRVRLFKSYRPGIADGEQTRDFLHVDDAAAATAWFLDHPEATGIFNIGSGVARSWNDLAKAVFAALGRAPEIEYIEMPEAIRAAYQYSTCADITRLRAAGCTIPFRSLEEGVRDYVAHLLA